MVRKKKPGKRLRVHCAALKRMLTIYLRLIRSTAGQWRLMFKAKADSIQRELAEVCDETAPTAGEA